MQQRDMQLQSDSCPMESMAMIYSYIRIATVGTTIRQLTPPCMITYMSTPGNTAKLGTATDRQHKVIGPWWGANLQCISQHTTESAHKHTMPARHTSVHLKVCDKGG